MADAFKKAGILSPEERERAEIDRLKSETKTIFDRALKDRFSEIPDGVRFDSPIPSLDTITVVPSDSKECVYLIGWYKANGKETKIIFTLTKSGELLGALPRQLGGEKEKLTVFKDVLERIEKLDLSYFVIVDPKGEKEKSKRERLPSAGDREPVLTQEVIDRILFIRKLSGKSVGFVISSLGFKDYHGFIVPELKWVVLEHPEYGNALFFIKDIPEIPELMTSSLEKRKELIENQPWFSNFNKLRTTVKALPDVVRIEHKKSSDWQSAAKRLFDQRKEDLGI